jgi:ABC-2 type transport system permease protein
MKSIQPIQKWSHKVTFLRKAFAFIRRDFIEETSYKFAFFLQFFGIFISVLIFYFLSRLFGAAAVPYLKPYGGDYFSFVLIGVAFTNYLEVSLNSFSSSIRNAQMTGTLEAILVTQTEIPTIIISSSLYSFIWTSFRVIVYLLIGVFLFDVNISQANFAGAGVILLLTITTFSSIGIISASFIMVLKKGDPLASLFSGLSWFLGGVYYPIAVLPSWLRRLSYLIPLTYSLEGMRFALLKGYSLRALSPNIVALGAFSLIMLPLGVFSFRFAVNKAKRDGSLTHY